MDRGLCHRGRHHVGRSRPDPCHQIANDHARNPRGNPAPPAPLRRVERTVHDGRPDRLVTTWRQRLGRREKIGAGVVHQAGERSRGPDIRHHLFDAVGIANVGDPCVGLPSRPRANLNDSLLQNFRPTAANEDVRAMCGKAQGNLLTEPCPAAGHEDALSLEEVSVEHESAILLFDSLLHGPN